jgi:DNA topoisomerase-1
MEDIKRQQTQTDYKCELCGKPMVFRWSRSGGFLGCSGFPKCKNTKPAKRLKDGKIEAIKAETTDEICDKCKKPMVVKYSNHGRFLGCSDYPKCKNTKSFSTGIRCPQPDCGGQLIERYFKRRLFYGCSNYPRCRYTVTKLPQQ